MEEEYLSNDLFHVSSSQEEELENCKFAMEDSESESPLFGSEPVDTPIESTEILMVSPPDSNTSQAQLFQTPLIQRDSEEVHGHVERIAKSMSKLNSPIIIPSAQHTPHLLPVRKTETQVLCEAEESDHQQTPAKGKLHFSTAEGGETNADQTSGGEEGCILIGGDKDKGKLKLPPSLSGKIEKKAQHQNMFSKYDKVDWECLKLMVKVVASRSKSNKASDLQH